MLRRLPSQGLGRGRCDQVGPAEGRNEDREPHVATKRQRKCQMLPGISPDPTFREIANFTTQAEKPRASPRHGPGKVYTSDTSRTPKTTPCQFSATGACYRS